ncbi:MAG: hypothetical protein ABSA86_02800, partial [Oryzomonas sp.]
MTTDPKFFDDLQDELAKQNPREDFPEHEDICNSLIRFTAEQILPYAEWLNNGAIRDENQSRQDNDFISAMSNFESYISQLPLREQLKELVNHQAHIFWSCRGAIQDNNIDRIDTDYFDAKRYFGFLIADTMINKCLNGELEFICFNYIKEEFVDYLKVISVEEYIRIRAYLNWINEESFIDSNKDRIDSNYFEAINTIHNSMWNCRERITSASFMSEETKRVLENYLNGSDTSEVISGKRTTGKRLKYESI